MDEETWHKIRRFSVNNRGKFRTKSQLVETAILGLIEKGDGK